MATHHEYNLIIAIIFNLTIGLTLVPLIESHTVWVHNKMWPGTYGMLAVMVNGQERNSGASYARHGFSVEVFDDVKTFNLSFSVEASSEKDKNRGPFSNDKDHEWKFTGSIDAWNIEELS
ncbi:4103_t:CDS:2 [Diversispora eburnea]|uniref:4103_t:CDS:1 n=1 Tax=Diversispora eburnea TaxID=1213867 RepID=A0A9N8ZNU6_9GLOM|nr:4103_t:CDS:2 [Diversispora eburnea]